MSVEKEEVPRRYIVLHEKIGHIRSQIFDEDYTLADAIQKAKALAGNQPERLFYVLESVAVFRSEPIVGELPLAARN